MNKIQFTSGCPNNCSYCYEPKEIQCYDPEIPITKDLIQIKDMNFLANPRAIQLLETMPKGKYEFICGVDFRRMTQNIADLMKQKGFIKVRWAWDFQLSQQKTHQKVWRMFKKAGYRTEELSVFMLVNWKIPFVECCKKLDLLKVWNVKVNDCCNDGGYPKSEIDFNNNPRFNNKRYWRYQDIKKFGKGSNGMCRKHNQIVRFKIDPELKS